jgi:hypothetical protein
VKGALAMVDMLADDADAKKHRDLRRTEIERSEANAKNENIPFFKYLDYKSLHKGLLVLDLLNVIYLFGLV